MTLQKRFIADLKDILAIRLTCKRCKTTLSMQPDERAYFPQSCPTCRNQWFIDQTQDQQILEYFIRSITEIKKRGDEAPCQIQIDFEQPE